MTWVAGSLVIFYLFYQNYQLFTRSRELERKYIVAKADELQSLVSEMTDLIGSARGIFTNVEEKRIYEGKADLLGDKLTKLRMEISSYQAPWFFSESVRDLNGLLSQAETIRLTLSQDIGLKENYLSYANSVSEVKAQMDEFSDLALEYAREENINGYIMNLNRALRSERLLQALSQEQQDLLDEIYRLRSDVLTKKKESRRLKDEFDRSVTLESSTDYSDFLKHKLKDSFGHPGKR